MGCAVTCETENGEKGSNFEIKINKYKKQGMSLAVATVLSRLWFCL